MDSSRAVKALAFAVMALLLVSCSTPSGSFVTTPRLGGCTAAPGTSIACVANERRGACSATSWMSTVSCALVAAAGVLSLACRRSYIPTKVWKEEPIPVVNWEVDPKVPVPGSEKALKAMVGAGPEINNGEIWDPMGFSKLYDRNFDFNMVMTYPHVQWLREAEIKHGRVCMLAFVGMVVQQFFQIPGEPQEPDWTKALDACYASKVGTLGVIQISVFCMLVEGRWFPEGAWIGQMDREPGDLGFDPLKLTKKPGYDLKEKQLSELKNGRLAMVGVASMAANHAIPGSVPLLTGAY